MASGPLRSAFPPPSRHHCRRFVGRAPAPPAERPGLSGAAGGDAVLAACHLSVPGREPLGPLPFPLASSLSPAGGPLSCGRKHRMVEEPEGCPAKKKALVQAGPRIPQGAAAAAEWMSPGTLDAPCEDMDQARPEQHCETARQKLQEIEDRLTEEEEEEEEVAETSVRHLPTLVLSHTLQTGLKQDYEGILNKKIIESMSRPSMELVLWKPLPEFLPKNHSSIKSYKPLVAERGLGKVAALEATFQSQTEEFSEQPRQTEMPLAHYGAVGPSGAAEEEMEL